MTTTRHTSLLNLPPELRVRIYRYLFQVSKPTIRLHMSATRNADGQSTNIIKPETVNKATVDSGITLVSHLLRIEAMPVLQESLLLFCNIGPSYRGPRTLPVKGIYLMTIRKLHITFECLSWEMTYELLPSLEIIYIECNNGWGPADVENADAVQKLAEAGDTEWFVNLVKRAILEETVSSTLEDMLHNSDRGFKVLWRDHVCSFDEEEPPSWVWSSGTHSSPNIDKTNNRQWLMFDWDTQKIIEGDETILRLYKYLMKDNAAEASDRQDSGDESEPGSHEGVIDEVA